MTQDAQDNSAAAAAAAPGDGAQTQVAQAVAATAKAKAKGTGNLIHDIAVDIENLTKAKALHRAEKLAENIDGSYFELGGLLKLIAAQQWYEGFPTFEAYVQEKFGYGVRKANYLIGIYTHLVDNQIPWEKVAHLGWTKLKDLTEVLTLENLDDWVSKAEKVTVMELQALIKASKGGTGTGTTTTANTTTDVVKFKATLHADQAEQVNTALAKAKGEMQTDHDNVALTAICSGYLANSSSLPVATTVDMVATFKTLGYEQVLQFFDQAFPFIDLDVQVNNPADAAAASAAATLAP